MKTTTEHNQRIAKMTFASVYPHYITKITKKGRTIEELHQVIMWLTGYDESEIKRLILEKATFESFFRDAELNPNAHLIKGMICGYRIEEIEDKFEVYKKSRRMEKLIDELARGRKMEKIMRAG